MPTSGRAAIALARRGARVGRAPATGINSAATAYPSSCKGIKREISDSFGEAYAELAGILNEERLWAKATLPTYQDRKVFFEAIVNGDPDPIDLLRRGDAQGARDLIAAHVHAVDSTAAPA